MADPHSSPAFADQRGIPVDGHQHALPPQEAPVFRVLPPRRHSLVHGSSRRSVRIEPVVPDLLELAVRYVDDESGDERGDGVGHVHSSPLPALLEPVVLVRVVVPGHGALPSVEPVDPSFAYRRVRGIARHVLRKLDEVRPPVCLPSRAPDIEPLRVLRLRRARVRPEGPYPARRVLLQPSFHRRQERVHESLSPRLEGEVGDVPEPSSGGIAFRDQDVEVRMPLQVSPEGVEERDEAEPAVLFLPCGRGISRHRLGERLRHRGEQDVEHAAVLPEPWSQPLRHGKDELSVGDPVELLADGCRNPVPVFFSARGAEPRFAGEQDEDVVAAPGAFRDHVSVLQLSASEGLLHALDDSGPGESVHVFSLEGLPPLIEDVPDPDLAALSSCLQAVVEGPDEVRERVAPGRGCRKEPVAELPLPVIRVRLEVRMREMPSFHIDIVTSGQEKG